MAGGIMGVFMWAVHPVLVKPVDQVNLGVLTGLLKGVVKQPFDHDEYSLFTTLLQIVGLLSFPATGLQIVFAQQAAAAVTPEQERQLRRTVHTVLGGALGIWLVGIAVLFLFRDQILGQLRITHPASFWLTMLSGLLILCVSVLYGVLQGRQNFKWLGWLEAAWAARWPECAWVWSPSCWCVSGKPVRCGADRVIPWIGVVG